MSSTATQDDTGLYIAYGALMTMAVIPIYHGSIASLRGMKRPANAKKRQKTDSPLEDSDDEDETVSESLSSSDAWWFPVMGSAVLFSLYLVFRFVDKKYINYLMMIYFSLIGCFAVAKTGLMFTKKLVPASLVKGRIEKYRLTLSKKGKHLSHISFTVIHFFLLALSMVLTAYYIITKNWIASNIFGFSFSVNAIQLLSIDSFKTGIILLSGLFLYDIFWVFGTEVMVTVAKGFDAPIKVVWPRDIISYLFDSSVKEHGFTMLGLGDIVIPGIFVALCLRFDRHMAWNRNPVGEFRSTAFPKPYFRSCLIAYILGLATTMLVMHVFHAAQPALLYLSPACILSSLLTAVIRGELKDLFAYTTEVEEDEEKKKSSAKDKQSDNEEGADQVSTTASPDDEDYVAVDDDNKSPATEKKTRSRSSKKKSK